ncbi:hypothetical protein A9Q76_05655 [Arcobacter sp. 31_11_sub10_T18]|nr:hypothetical protein A9Q76_05655 [Arcobacter sp. 31_11_sub10_T18]
MFVKNLSYYIITITFGLFISCVIYFYTNKHILESNQEEFEHMFKHQASMIQKEVDFNIEILESLGALFKTHNNISRDQFKTFVETPLLKHANIKALEWIPKVTHNQRLEYEREASKDLNLKYEIKKKLNSGEILTQDKKNTYFPVYYLEPLKGNEIALGFDLSSNSVRFDSLKKAIKTRKIIATSRVKLVQEEENQYGILVFSPVWEKNNSKKIKGFVLAVYRIGDIVTSALNRNHMTKLADIWLFDNTNSKNKELLYTNTNNTNNINSYSSHEIHINGRNWSLHANPSQVLLKKNYSSLPFVSFVFSLIIIYLISYIFKSNINKTHELKKLINMKTNDLKLLNSNLKQKIHKGIEENRKKDEMLSHQSKLAAMGEMMGNIAHQWRQPLNIIGALNLKTQTLIELHGPLSETQYSKISDNIEIQLNYMSKTIDDFRNFFRTDKVTKDFKIVDHINNSLNILNTQLKHLNIALDVNGDDFTIHGLENEFQQVILNIINNAKDALIENEIKNGKIEVKTQIVNSNGIISIQDNAGGISDKIIKRVFEPYYTTKEKTKGTGIGLYMSKIIIENNMKGHLSVFNVNNGACFIIRLNIIPEENKLHEQRTK